MDMSASRAEVISVDDGQLIELLRAARRKIFFAGPGMSLPVAQALCKQLKVEGWDRGRGCYVSADNIIGTTSGWKGFGTPPTHNLPQNFLAVNVPVLTDSHSAMRMPLW